MVGDIVECRQVICVPEDALGSFWLQYLENRGWGQAPKFHLDGSRRQPGQTPEHNGHK